MTDVTWYDEADLSDVKNALGAGENMLSYTCGPDGRLERFAATYDDGKRAQVIENVNGDYESITIHDEPEEYFDQLDQVFEGLGNLVDSRFGRLFDAGHRMSNRTDRFYLPDSDGVKEAVEDMRSSLPDETPERIIIVEGAAPKRSFLGYRISVTHDTDSRLPVSVDNQELDYSSLDPEQVYQQLPEDFKTGCQAGSCGETYFVQDGQITPFSNPEGFVPAELDVFVD